MIQNLNIEIIIILLTLTSLIDFCAFLFHLFWLKQTAPILKSSQIPRKLQLKLNKLSTDIMFVLPRLLRLYIRPNQLRPSKRHTRWTKSFCTMLLKSDFFLPSQLEFQLILTWAPTSAGDFWRLWRWFRCYLRLLPPQQLWVSRCRRTERNLDISARFSERISSFLLLQIRCSLSSPDSCRTGTNKALSRH